MPFESTVTDVGEVDFPRYEGIRVMMMPFLLQDVWGTLPDSLADWRTAVGQIVDLGGDHHGTAYLTIDEAFVARGTTHRRPGLHVDGVGPDGDVGGWGGGGGYGASGMLMASSRIGCIAWNQEFVGWPGRNGDCGHLADQCRSEGRVVLMPHRVYKCSPMTVHESLPAGLDQARQFVRVSMPSAAPWYEGYTENPLGIKPTGPIHPRRVREMGYRP